MLSPSFRYNGQINQHHQSVSLLSPRYRSRARSSIPSELYRVRSLIKDGSAGRIPPEEEFLRYACSMPRLESVSRGYRMKPRCNLVPAKISPRGPFSKELTDHSMPLRHILARVFVKGKRGQESTRSKHERELIWRTCGGTSSLQGNPGVYAGWKEFLRRGIYPRCVDEVMWERSAKVG